MKISAVKSTYQNSRITPPGRLNPGPKIEEMPSVRIEVINDNDDEDLFIQSIEIECNNQKSACIYIDKNTPQKIESSGSFELNVTVEKILEDYNGNNGTSYNSLRGFAIVATDTNGNVETSEIK